MSRVREVVLEKLSSVIRGQHRDPRLAEVAYHFIHLCGGPRGFAEALQEEFNKAPSGSVVRQRIMDMVLRSLKIANEQTPSLSDLSQLTDDDLERELTLKAQEWVGYAQEEEKPVVIEPAAVAPDAADVADGAFI